MINQPTDHEPLPEPLNLLQQRYPNWSIWMSTPYPGRSANCYATRMCRRLTVAEVRAGLSMTLVATDADGLDAKLAAEHEQEREVRL